MEQHRSGFVSLRARARMIKRLRERLPSSPGLDRTLEAMMKTPRHHFIASAWHHHAYSVDGLASLPIGMRQSISQPLVVAQMSAFLCDHCRMNRVLEIGTGSGYQTSILSLIARSVCSIERLRSLHLVAKQKLRALSINNVSLLHADGYHGWPSTLLFDGVILTAAPSQLPERLLGSLNQGGCLIAPVGGGERQQLKGYIKHSEQNVQEVYLGEVSFVPMLTNTQ